MSGLLWITGSTSSVGGGAGDSGGIWFSGPLVEATVSAGGAMGGDGAMTTGGPSSGVSMDLGAGAGFAVVLGLGRETTLGFAVGAFTAAGFTGVELAAGGGGVTGLVVVFLGALLMSGFMVWISLSLCTCLGLMAFAPLPRGNRRWHGPEAAFGGSSGVFGQA